MDADDGGRAATAYGTFPFVSLYTRTRTCCCMTLLLLIEVVQWGRPRPLETGGGARAPAARVCESVHLQLNYVWTPGRIP